MNRRRWGIAGIVLGCVVLLVITFLYGRETVDCDPTDHHLTDSLETALINREVLILQSRSRQEELVKDIELLTIQLNEKPKVEHIRHLVRDYGRLSVQSVADSLGSVY